MTRETKIGLLVGLAFIIVIGILLSDHINSSSDPVPAAMSQSYYNVERSVSSPDSRNQGSLTVVTPPQPIIPTTPVPTTREPVTKSGSSVVVVGPGSDPSQLPRTNRTLDGQPGNIEVSAPRGAEIATNRDPDKLDSPDSAVAEPLNQVAKNNHEELVAMNGGPVHLESHPGDGRVQSNAGQATKAGATASDGRRIKAEEGDTVSKLAGRYMGANNKANREAIIKVNPSLGPDGRRLLAGQTYVIPVTSGAPAVFAVSQDKPAVHLAPSFGKTSPPPVPASTTMYTVKDNDSLWKIAAEELGSGNRWTEIRDLNKDILKGGEQVHASMRLKLPAKTVASAE